MTTRPKQANNKKVLEFKNYLLARMQCKGQGCKMLKDTTCKHLWKLILSLQMSPCGIMDLSLAFWSYKFSPLHRLIHNPLSSLSRTMTTCRPLPLVNIMILLLVLQINAYFWSSKFSPFGIKHQKGRH